jgi:hypothetical protein
LAADAALRPLAAVPTADENFGAQLAAAQADTAQPEAAPADAEAAKPAPRLAPGHAPRVVAVVPSRWSGREIHVEVNAPIQFSLVVEDEDGDTLKVAPLGLPEGASFDEATRTLRWTPTNVGEWVVRLVASDGQREASHTVVILVRPAPPPEPLEKIAPEPIAPAPEPDVEWESFLLPGVGYASYAPRQRDLKLFHGIALELVPVSWIHKNNNRGPSHGRLYVTAELLRAAGSEPLLFAYSFGTTLSFERNPAREWGIPYYGVDVGGFTSKHLGSHFQTTPHLGIHAYTSPNLFVNLRAGYRLVPGEMDRLAGLHVAATVDLSVW